MFKADCPSRLPAPQFLGAQASGQQTLPATPFWASDHTDAPPAHWLQWGGGQRESTRSLDCRTPSSNGQSSGPPPALHMPGPWALGSDVCALGCLVQCRPQLRCQCPLLWRAQRQAFLLLQKVLEDQCFPRAIVGKRLLVMVPEHEGWGVGVGARKSDTQAAPAERLGLPASRTQLSGCFIERRDLQAASSNHMWPLPGWEGTVLGHQRLAFSGGAQILGHRPFPPQTSTYPGHPGEGRHRKTPPEGLTKSVCRVGDHGQRAREKSGEATLRREGTQRRPRRLGDRGAEGVHPAELPATQACCLEVAWAPVRPL